MTKMEPNSETKSHTDSESKLRSLLVNGAEASDRTAGKIQSPIYSIFLKIYFISFI